MAATSLRDPQRSKADRKASTPVRRGRRVATVLALVCCAAGMGACQNVVDNVSDYFNLRNSFLNPAEVGRFDKANPWGKVRPVTWPILDQLAIIDSPGTEWDSATDPVSSDLVPDSHEAAIGPGDVLRLSIYDLASPGAEYNKEAVVSEAGTVDILYLGAVKVSGLTPSQANEKIGQTAVDKKAILPAGNGNLGPQVSVMVVQSRARIFSILGLVARPGTYNILSSNFRVLDALALAGDIPIQPGLDYLYVIRATQNEAQPALVTPPSPDGATSPTPTPTGNPLDALDNIQKNTATAPASGSPPAPSMTPSGTPPATPAPMGPGSKGPAFLRPLPTAVVMSGTSGHPALAYTDLEAALSGNPATAPATSKPAAGGDDLLNQAVDSGTAKAGQSVFVDGKWVKVPAAGATGAQPTGAPAEAPAAQAAPAMPGPGPVAPQVPAAPNRDAFAAAERMSGQRVIKIPIAALRSGDPRYNIVIRPGDVINVPPVETGEFYMLGHVNRMGVYALTGRKITLKMAVAAAGGLDPVAIPRRCDLVRRIGTNQEAIVQVNLQAIFDGTQPDIFLKPNDLVNVGTDMIAPFLAVTRNAYRLSYGFGFVYDRNFFIQPQGKVE